MVECRRINLSCRTPDRFMRYVIYSLIFFLVLPFHGWGQQFLTGKIYKKNSTETLLSVSIHNISQQRYDLSDEDGSYRIPAAPGDHIAFSSVGYMADTLTVTASLLTANCPIYLDIRPQELQAVRVVLEAMPSPEKRRRGIRSRPTEPSSRRTSRCSRCATSRSSRATASACAR